MLRPFVSVILLVLIIDFPLCSKTTSLSQTLYNFYISDKLHKQISGKISYLLSPYVSP